MKKTLAVVLTLTALLGVGIGPAYSRPADETGAAPFQVATVTRTTKAINYGHLGGATNIDFRGTALLPLAKGHAKVESKRGAVKIQAQFEKMQPASQFGLEYLTYVLWAITPVGRVSNLGEVLLQGSKSKVDVTAELQTFALIVTAEPYFAVTQPSDVVVLENVARAESAGKIVEVDAKFDLLQRGQYANASAASQPLSMDPRVPLGLYEARSALKIAKAAGADHYAADSFTKAEQLLKQAENYQSHNAGKPRVEMTARESVQTAEDARTITVKRRDEERQEAERRAAAERETRAKAEVEEAAKRRAQAEADRLAAERARLEAQLAAERAARERAEAEASRAAVLAQQQSLQTEAERAQAERAAAVIQQQAAQAEAIRARQAADLEARQRAEAEAAGARALAQQQAAQAEAARARQSAEQADVLRRQAEAEKAELRAHLLSQLSRILQTHDSARGLIVNMSDVLFDSGSYTLRAGAREKLAKVSGIVLAYPGLSLQVEGHTDSVGSEERNQQLSVQRASVVRDFLVQQGVRSGSITARGFGKSQPVASNDSTEGRQQNRRVELVVAGDAIGTSTIASTEIRQQ